MCTARGKYTDNTAEVVGRRTSITVNMSTSISQHHVQGLSAVLATKAAHCSCGHTILPLSQQHTPTQPACHTVLAAYATSITQPRPPRYVLTRIMHALRTPASLSASAALVVAAYGVDAAAAIC